MKIKSIKPIGFKPVYDITVADAHHYVLENGAVTHNTGIYYSADNIWIIGRQQDKDNKEKELQGYNFIINIDKSRFVKEKSKIPVTVSFDKGIRKWSGFLDLALEAGFIVSPKNGRYARVDADGIVNEGDNFKKVDIEFNDEFWTNILEETSFSSWLEMTYKIANGSMIND